MMIFKDKVALVTGGAQGIGKAICMRLAKEGADIAVVDINLDTAQATAKEIESLGRKSIALKVNVSNFTESEKMVEDAVASLGGLHILVNNAGITRDKLLLRMTEDEIGRAS